MVEQALYSSTKMDWETPPALFQEVGKIWGPFTLDAAASEANAKATRYFNAKIDGLSQPWEGVVWCNPPYGRGIDKWIAKGAWEAKHNPYCERVVFLVPARTDTAWWHDHVMPEATTVRLIRGRVKFVGGEASAPFPSALILFDGNPAQPGRPLFMGWRQDTR